MKRIIRTIVVLSSAIAFSAIADAPADYAYRIPVAGTGDAAFLWTVLPPEVYEGAVHSDLRDLRIFNSDGSIVPYAFLPQPPQASQRGAQTRLPVFPLRVDEQRNDFGDLSISIRKNASGTSVDISTKDGRPVEAQRLSGYLVDATEIDEPLAALSIPIARTNVTTRIRIEGSDDLAQWRDLGGGPVFALEYNGRLLSRDRVELPNARAKYLRLTWDSRAPAPELSYVFAERRAWLQETARQWREVAPIAKSDDSLEYTYDIGGTFPADRVTLVLSEVNTVAPADIAVRANASDPWRPVLSGVFYRLRDGEREIENAPLTLSPGSARYWRIRFDARSWAASGAPPRLSIGWQPNQVIFAARGQAPFVIAYGSRVAQPGALAIETLVPGYDPRKELPANVGRASITVARDGVTSPVATLANPAALKQPVDWKRWTLWGTLLAAVVVLALMALSLAKRMQASPAASAPAPTEPARE
jgi:hypothetical protein